MIASKTRKNQTSLVAKASALAVLLFSGLAIYGVDAEDAQQEPEPAVVDPGPIGGPPSDAVVVFGGTGLSGFRGEGSSEPGWKLVDGAMEVAGSGGVFSKEEFGDCQIHVEWATPSVVSGEGQGRGNSGVYVLGRYEIQVLDSYQNKTYPNGQAGGYYGHNAPLVNASRKPGEWQTYDIVFHAPALVDGIEKPGSFTVLHNGVLIQDHVPVSAEPTAGAPLEGVAETGPLFLQNHGNPVRFRNIWVRRL